MFTNTPNVYNGIRFYLDSKSSLVNWINVVNNRSFTVDDFIFDTPVSEGGDGWVRINGTYVPTDEPMVLRVQRVDLSKLNGVEPLVIHVPSYDKKDIADAIFEQYGILLELDLFEMTITRMPIENIIGYTLDGFDGSAVPVLDPVIDYWNGEGTLTISPDHLTLEGTITFKVRSAMLSFENRIDSVLSLRQFYSNSDSLLPFVETIQPKGVWTLDKNHFGTMSVKKEVEAKLYEMSLSEDTIVDYVFIAQVLSSITNQEWISSQSPTPFNVMGSIIKYNGVAGEHPNVAPVEYSYLMILQLSDLCDNLQGDIHIAYQYANYKHPLYGNKSLAGAPPL